MAFYQFTPADREPFGSFETFYAQGSENVNYHDLPEFECITAAGFYWQSCFPGCMPDGEAVGPFQTEAEAIADANS